MTTEDGQFGTGHEKRATVGHEGMAICVAKPAGKRGERLYPSRWSRLYWHLTCLRREFETIVQDYLQSCSLGRLVDYGCGNMPYRRLFEPHVQEYIGCDFPGNELKDRELDGHGIVPIETGSVDVVLSSQVLEHVRAPRAYLGEARRLLRPNGLLILSTHGVWKYHPDPNDYWRWTCDGLRLEIKEAAFEIVEFCGVMGPEATALQLLQDSVLPRLPKICRPVYKRQMQKRIERADRRCPAETRNSDACVYVTVSVAK